MEVFGKTACESQGAGAGRQEQGPEHLWDAARWADLLRGGCLNPSVHCDGAEIVGVAGASLRTWEPMHLVTGVGGKVDG